MDGQAGRGTPSPADALLDGFSVALAHWFVDPCDVATQYRMLEELHPQKDHRRTFGALVTIMRELVLTDAGRLGEISSPNHARLVTTARGERRVVKLSADAPGDERLALRTWSRATRHMARTADVLACGRTDDGLTWSLQEHLPGLHLSRTHLRQHLLPVLRVVRGLHNPIAGSVDGLDALYERVLNVSPETPLETLRRAILLQLEELDGVTGLVHGNLTAENLLWTGARFTIVGAWGVHGLPSSDIARLVVDTDALIGGISSRMEPLAEDLRLNERELRILTAAELLLRAHRSRVDGGWAARLLTDEAWRCLP